MKSISSWRRIGAVGAVMIMVAVITLLAIPKPTTAAGLFQTLVWSDEFNGKHSPSSAKWNYDLGGGGWGNGELQTYTSNRNNVKQSNGNLIIQANYNASTGTYTSARIKTQNKASWMYGRIDVRAKLPRGVGSWPAIWMMPQGAKYGSTYLANGEIDIMEEVGADQNEVSSSAHSQTYNPANRNVRYCLQVVEGADTAFHVYSLEWAPSHLSFLIDGTEYCRVNNDYTGYLSWPYDQPYYLIMNLAVGGSWGGYAGIDNSSFPWVFAVDYVRVYQ